MARKRAVGEGTIYRRKDGRYEIAVKAEANVGTRKRIRAYANSRAEADEKLTELKRQIQQGIPLPDKAWRLGPYLDHWLEEVVRPTRRATTYELYEGTVRLNLKPDLGTYRLRQLSVLTLQRYLNQQLASGKSIRKVQVIRTVLSAALTRAQREELLTHNVARLVELPTWERQKIRPWTLDEAGRFLEASAPEPTHLAFLLLVLYGLRRGEVLGLQWTDIDFTSSVIHIQRQLQRVGGALRLGEVKTSAGRRDLPLLDTVRALLEAQRTRQDSLPASSPIVDGLNGDNFIVTSALGNPMDPRNFGKTFDRICAQHGIRRIKLHHIRHTTATLLKKLGVPDRDIQLILGHSRITLTQEIYQHDDADSRRENLARLEAFVGLERVGSSRSRQVAPHSRQNEPSSVQDLSQSTSVKGGGVWGIRTPHLLRAISIQQPLGMRIQEVNHAVEGWASSWRIGVVAVNSSRQGIPLKRSIYPRLAPVYATKFHARFSAAPN